MKIGVKHILAGSRSLQAGSYPKSKPQKRAGLARELRSTPKANRSGLHKAVGIVRKVMELTR